MILASSAAFLTGLNQGNLPKETVEQIFTIAMGADLIGLLSAGVATAIELPFWQREQQYLDGFTRQILHP